jgi:hypothetical protein
MPLVCTIVWVVLAAQPASAQTSTAIVSKNDSDKDMTLDLAEVKEAR